MNPFVNLDDEKITRGLCDKVIDQTLLLYVSVGSVLQLPESSGQVSLSVRA